MLTQHITHRDNLARAGTISTAHGVIDTPNFMTVGTLGAPKAVTPQQVLDCGAQVMLMNAFHLAWRPGEQTVKKLGGLHRFTGWKGPILTDSGGYQIFSLPGLRKITEEGALFASAVDGSARLFSPESVVDIELALAPDIAMVLDECPAHPCTSGQLIDAVERSVRWARRSYEHAQLLGHENVNFFGIIQGGFEEKLRKHSLEATAAIPFEGFALGGFCVGEPIEMTHAGIAYTTPLMPAEKPRYLMGMGTPLDILLAVKHGMDLFDCTLPTRNGRNGTAFTSKGKVRIKNARHSQSDLPLDESCGCYTCRNFCRAFLRHLLLSREMNAAILISLHNLAFYLNLMREIREAIKNARFESFSKEFLDRMNSGDERDDEQEENA